MRWWQQLAPRSDGAERADAPPRLDVAGMAASDMDLPATHDSFDRSLEAVLEVVLEAASAASQARGASDGEVCGSIINFSPVLTLYPLYALAFPPV